MLIALKGINKLFAIAIKKDSSGVTVAFGSFIAFGLTTKVIIIDSIPLIKYWIAPIAINIPKTVLIFFDKGEISFLEIRNEEKKL